MTVNKMNRLIIYAGICAVIMLSMNACNSNTAELDEFRDRQDSLSIPANDNVIQEQQEQSPVEVSPKKPVEQPAWADKKIEKAIRKLYMANTTGKTSYEYLADYTERDGKPYISVEIGTHDDDKFTVEKWLYIDTLNKKVYEHDMVNDKLIEVKD